MTKKGKIIAVVGAPRSGKSFLVRKLAERFDAKMIFEGEEGDFPTRIEEDIRENIRPLERVLWFRTMLVEKYLQAVKMKSEGHTVILDVFWMTPHMFIDTLLEGFERELMWEVAMIDRKLLGWPDLTVFLKISEDGIRKFVKLGGRSFDQSENVIVKQILPVKEMNDKFFAKEEGEHILTVDRDNLDFEKKEDLENLISQIQKILVK